MKKFYYLSTVFLALLLVGTNVRTMAQTLVQPTSTGIVWVIGNTYNITWTGDENADYDLWYSINDVAVLEIADDVSGNTFAWNTTGFAEGEEYKIEVRSTDGTGDISYSLNYFELTETLPEGDGEIHVEQPNVAGIQWEPGTQHGIYWVDDLVEPVKLELWTSNDGVNFTEYTAQETGLPTSVEGTGYIWTIGVDIEHASNYYIKVMSTTTDDFDYGDNPFAITNQFSGGTEVNMLQPDVAGLQWESGTTHLVSWMDDLIENVNLELLIEWPATSGTYYIYDDNVGGGVPYTVASDLPTNRAGTTVDWDIPATLPNGNYKIHAESSVTSSIDNDSEYSFAVTDTPSGGTYITLIQPEEAGIQWLFEGTYVISWMDDLIEPVDIELWKSGAKLGTIDVNVVGTTYDWTIPAEGSGGIDDDVDYQIKIVSSATPPTTSAISTNPFEITATPSGGTEIVVIQPSVTGIEWEEGTEHLISWMDDLIEPVNIKLVNYFTGSAVDVGAGVSGIPVDDYTGTTWTWDIPATGLVGANLGPFKIVITSSASGITDDSEFTFDIIDYSPYGEVIMIQPNGGEEWIKDNSYLISWTDNISENVDIEVTNNSSAGSPTWFTLTPDPAGVPSSTWTWNTATNWPFGATVIGSDFKIKISSVNTSSSATGISEDPFSFVNTIGGEVWVIQPNGGEVWIDETEYIISWMDELVENVYIKLYKDGTLVDNVIAGLPSYVDGIGVEGTTWTWDIPETSGVDINTQLVAAADYKIRIESIYDPQYFDISEGTFTIAAEQTGGTTIEVIQPNGGEEWALNTTHLISWNDDVFEDVVIALYDDNLVFIKEIEDNVEGTTYEWDIDDAEFGVGTYRVRVYSTEDGTLQDYSDSFFTITGTKSTSSNLNLGFDNSTLVMYPNPASTQFTVAASSIIERIEVRNLLGQIIFSNEINAVQTNIDISSFDTGLYIVNVIIEGNVVTKKLFVQ